MYKNLTNKSIGRNEFLYLSYLYTALFVCRRQTAEEREQERQAATKYFLSMQLGSLGPPPPHMDPNLVTPPHSHLSPEPTTIPPSSLIPQRCSPLTTSDQTSFIPGSTSLSPSIHTSHPLSTYRPASSPVEMQSTEVTKAGAANLDNKNSINALECLRPWTSPHSPPFPSITVSGTLTSSSATSSSIDTLNDTTIEKQSQI